MMPYFDATPGFSSTLSFTILTLSPMTPAISSSAGAIMRHGPHHSAQKSTTTGLADLSTSASKVASDTLPTVMEYLVSRIGGYSPGSREPMNATSERQGASRPGEGSIQRFGRNFH